MSEQLPTNFEYFIGTDVSGATLDHVVMRRDVHLFHRLIANEDEAIREFLADLRKLKGFKLKNAVFCLENTGIYGTRLIRVFKELKANIVVENATHIKDSLGFQRNKSDKLDAKRIAEFAYRNRDELRFWTERREVINLMADLSTLRTRLTTMRAAASVPASEQRKYMAASSGQLITALCRASLAALVSDIKAIERTIMQLIREDAQLDRYFRIMNSIPGVGPVTAWQIIITTNEFRNIRSPKKFACYAGVAPFEHSSGTVTRKARISPAANKKMKALLHICAMSAKIVDPDIKTYFQRKLAEGKPKMAVINAIRNKIVLRIFACINQDRLYQHEYQRPKYPVAISENRISLSDTDPSNNRP